MKEHPARSSVSLLSAIVVMFNRAIIIVCHYSRSSAFDRRISLSNMIVVK